MNITLDFTASKTLNNMTAGQPLAVMPAALAKKLLQSMADQLSYADTRDIINVFRMSIDINGSIEDSINVALDYLQERELITNIKGGNWDAYAVDNGVIATEVAVVS